MFRSNRAFEFVIPLNTSDLWKDNKQIKRSLDDFESSTPEILSKAILLHQDNFIPLDDHIAAMLQILCKIPQIPEKSVQLVCDAAINALKNLCEYEFSKEFTQIPKEDCRILRNILKVLLYFCCSVLDEIESKSSVDSFKKPRSRKATPVNSGVLTDKAKSVDNSEIWKRTKRNLLDVINQIISSPIQNLWSPPVVEDEFIRMIINFTFKILENFNASKMKEDETLISTIDALATVVKKFNAALNVSLKIVKYLQHYENLAQPLATVVKRFVTKHNLQVIVVNIIRELSQGDYQSDAKSETKSRSIAAFLTALSEHIPKEFLINSSLLVYHLGCEPYYMRNAVLDCIYHMIVHLKNSAEVSAMSSRDSFFSLLEDHTMDVNAFVRSHCLQLLNNLCIEECVPIIKYQKFLILTKGRLVDRSCQVRKNAIILMKNLLLKNLFGSYLNYDVIKKNLEDTQLQLSHLLNQQQSHSNNDHLLSKWQEIKVSIDCESSSKDESEFDSSNDFSDSEVPSKIHLFDEIAVLVSQQKYKKAFKLIKSSLMQINEHQEVVEHQNAGEIQNSDLSGKNEIEMSVEILKSIFFEISSKNVACTQMDENGAEEIIASLDHGPNSAESSLVSIQIKRLMTTINFLKSGLNFTKSLTTADKILYRMLKSETSMDLLEVLDLLSYFGKFGVVSSNDLIDRLLPLLLSKEKNISSAAIESVWKVVTSNPGATIDGSQRELSHVVDSLLQLVKNAHFGKMMALETMIVSDIKNGRLSVKILDHVWERMESCRSNLTSMIQLTQLLSLIARIFHKKVCQRIDFLLEVGFCDFSPSISPLQISLAYYTLDVLSISFRQYAHPLDAAGDLSVVDSLVAEHDMQTSKFPNSHPAFTRIIRFLTASISSLSQSSCWMKICEKSVELICYSSTKPLELLSYVLKKLYKSVLSFYEACCGEPFDSKSQENLSRFEKNLMRSNPPFYCSLSRLIHMVGHVALCCLSLLDRQILPEMKRRRKALETIVNTRSTQQYSTMRRKSILATSTISDETTMTGAGSSVANSDDFDAEWIRQICETELLFSDGQLGPFVELILSLLHNPGSSGLHHSLTSSCVLALGKLMLISSEFCSQNLQLLFTLMHKSPIEDVRINCVIITGDITQRFPNLIEPWTPRIFEVLKNGSLNVRRTVVTILSSLILNDMIKVRGHISEFAVCIQDSDETVATRSRKFFEELAKKDCAIYNVLPDVISCLSDSERKIEEKTFHQIMGFLLKFIQNEKQREALVDKLCHRFLIARNDQQVLEIIYCLSQIQVSEKSFKKVSENFDFYKDKLLDESIYSKFWAFLQKCKKISIQLKVSVEELEQKIDNIRRKGLVDSGTVFTGTEPHAPHHSSSLEELELSPIKCEP